MYKEISDRGLPAGTLHCSLCLYLVFAGHYRKVVLVALTVM